MTTAGREDVILETSVLINFLVINRLDLLAAHPHYRFIVTEHVRAEITEDFPDQMSQLNTVVGGGAVAEIKVTELSELEAFAQLTASGRIGVGECSAIAVAARRGIALAIDDKRAIREALAFFPGLRILNTEALVVSLIRSGLLSVPEADSIKHQWDTQHRFRLPFTSFKERI
jgi:hypothetical protein